jgi:hypothetical protein
LLPSNVPARPRLRHNNTTASQGALERAPSRPGAAPSAPSSRTPNGLIMQPDF